MSATGASIVHAPHRERGRDGPITPLRALAAWALPYTMVLWMWSGGFVFIEPSPYELMFLVVLPVAVVAGFRLFRRTLNLLNLLIFFMPFALIGAFRVTHSTVPSAMIYVAVTMFLWVTMYFAANYVAASPRRNLGLMMRAYEGVAVFISILGTLAYLRLIPMADLFLLYGRAKATFQDPNVFGPFLVLPAMYALQRVLLCRGKRQLFAAIVFGILSIGVFVSFSRAAWGTLVFSSAFVFAACYLLEANRRERSRMLVLAIAGLVVAILALGALLSIPKVHELFLVRASAEQSYDTGSTGRFGRQGYAFDLALSHPFGIGPLEFRNLRVVEEPHDTYVKVLLTYGWFGGLAYYVLVLMTLKRGLGLLATASPNRLLMIPAIATFVPLAVESAIIDTDHWRHFFLVAGIIWGIAASYRYDDQYTPERDQRLI